MSELFNTDAWIALLELVGLSGVVTALGVYIEHKTERRK